MSTFKKLLALTLALAMVLSVSAFAGYSADTYADADKINEDCEDAVELMYALDIMVGDGKNFNPEATVTRAEMAKMIYVILNYGDDDKAANYTGAKIFSDVAAGAWYEGYVNYCGTTKLVQGRPDGTFGPMDPVTCAEAAKMLLTAIGYSAADRGYTGAEWANNVLSDAAIVGLLEDYNYNTNTYAPRQWVAVMMENALWSYTYATVRPVSFNGLLTSSALEKYNEATWVTMGQKYYGLKEITGVAIATPDAYIDGTKKADDKSVFFDDGDDVWEIRGTGLKVADLGQEYRVIYKAASSTAGYDGTAYSVSSLSETAEARTLDMEVDVKYATDSNKAYNKYEFTIGDMVATFEAYEVNVLFSGVNEAATGVYTEVSVDDLREMIKKDVNNNIWKAIDTDVNGKIDYFYVTEYDYAVVTEDDTHSKYGDYVTAYDLSDGEDKGELEFNDETRLYVEDCIISDDEIVEDNIVKYTWSLDDGKYVMEVLEVAEEIEYAARDSKKGIHELDGTDYMIADEADGKADDVLVAGNLGDAMDYVADEDLIVWIAESDSNYTDMADINAQLVLVLDVMDEYSNGKIREQNAIEYMTIDGETHIAGYQDVDDTKSTDYAQWAELANLKDVQDSTKYDNDKADWQKRNENKDDAYYIGNRLYIIHEGTKDRVYLEKLVDDANDPEAQLDASSSLLDGYAVKNNVALDTTGSSAKLDGDKIAAENVFFYGYFGTGGEAKYSVVTVADLDTGVAKTDDDYKAYAQVLTLDNSRGTRTTVVGGYIFANIESDTAGGYLFVDEILRETDEDYYRANVTLDDGTETEILIDKGSLAVKDYEEGYLYSYVYDVMDDYYKLTLKDVKDNDNEIIDYEDDCVIFENKTEAEMDDEVIAIVRVQVDRDENSDEFDYERNPYEYEIVETKFVAAEDLTAEMIVDEEEPADGYVQFTDYYHGDLKDGDEQLMYIVVWEVMDRYLGQDLTDSPLVCLLGQNVKEECADFKATNGLIWYWAAEEGRTYADSIYVELYDFAFAYTLDAVVYDADGNVLTYATLNTEEVEPGDYEIMGCIILWEEGESSDSWLTADWTPDADAKPATVKLFADNVELCEKPITLRGVTEDTPELTDADWAALVAGLAD